MHQQRLDLSLFLLTFTCHLRPRYLVASTSFHPAHDFHPQLAPLPSSASTSTPSTCHRKLARSHSKPRHRDLTLATSTRHFHSPLPLATTSRYDIANPTNDDSEHPQPIFPDLHQRSDHPTKSNTMASLKKTDDSQDHTLSTSLTVDNESSLSSSASVQKHQSFEATTAVLDTNELLHMIIAEVPLEYRPAIRVVSTI
jgi:hypothetical protein